MLRLVLDRLAVRPLPDPVLDTIGHDARGWYVEAFWLPVVGPTAIALLRRLVDGLDRQPGGFEIRYVELALSLGLGERPPSNSAPLTRALSTTRPHTTIAVITNAKNAIERARAPVILGYPRSSELPDDPTPGKLPRPRSSASHSGDKRGLPNSWD